MSRDIETNVGAEKVALEWTPGLHTNAVNIARY